MSSVNIALNSSETLFSLHCMGVGSEYQNSKLLYSLSTLTRTGSYHFTPNEQCLHEALLDVMRNAEGTNHVQMVLNCPHRPSSLPSSVLCNFTDMANCEIEELWERIAKRLHEATELLSSPHQQKIILLLSSLSFDAAFKRCIWAVSCARCMGFASEEFLAALGRWIHERGVDHNKEGQRGKLKFWKSASEANASHAAESQVVFADRFRVSRDVLGKGAYGSIYTARDAKTGTQVAVKKISYVNKSRSSVVLALRELRLMRQLSQHKNIVTLYGAEVKFCYTDQADLWVAMELLSIDLQQLIDSKQVR